MYNVSRETLLKTEAEKQGVLLDQQAMERFFLLGEQLREWNQTTNLTAITQPDEIIVKHFVDSLTVFQAMSFPEGAKVIDVGTGGGFPGLPLLIARPDLQLWMIDGTDKKLAFIRQVLPQMGLSAEVQHLRAEEGGKNPELRETFDIAVSRAMASFSPLCEYCLPFVKPGGAFIAMKGKGWKQELEAGKTAIPILGGKRKQTYQINLGEEQERCLIVVEKISQTPTKYPRNTGKIKKKPL